MSTLDVPHIRKAYPIHDEVVDKVVDNIADDEVKLPHDLTYPTDRVVEVVLLNNGRDHHPDVPDVVDDVADEVWLTSDVVNNVANDAVAINDDLLDDMEIAERPEQMKIPPEESEPDDSSSPRYCTRSRGLVRDLPLVPS